MAGKVELTGLFCKDGPGAGGRYTEITVASTN